MNEAGHRRAPVPAPARRARSSRTRRCTPEPARAARPGPRRKASTGWNRLTSLFSSACGSPGSNSSGDCVGSSALISTPARVVLPALSSVDSSIPTTTAIPSASAATSAVPVPSARSHRVPSIVQRAGLGDDRRQCLRPVRHHGPDADRNLDRVGAGRRSRRAGRRRARRQGPSRAPARVRRRARAVRARRRSRSPPPSEARRSRSRRAAGAPQPPRRRRRTGAGRSTTRPCHRSVRSRGRRRRRPRARAGIPISATAIQTAQPPSPITGRTDFRPASSRRRATPHATSPQRAPTSELDPPVRVDRAGADDHEERQHEGSDGAPQRGERLRCPRLIEAQRLVLGRRRPPDPAESDAERERRAPEGTGRRRRSTRSARWRRGVPPPRAGSRSTSGAIREPRSPWPSDSYPRAPFRANPNGAVGGEPATARLKG